MGAFDVVVATRKLEIRLFWTRSLFFWGFIASAFAGYAALKEHHSGLSILVASFGLVCSAAWSLVNRGSKYWQEAWEAKVERLEVESIGRHLFAAEEPEQTWKGCWLRGRRYSVSKLAIALSDYCFLVWLAICIWELICLSRPQTCVLIWLKHDGSWCVIVTSAIYVLLLLWKGRSSGRGSSPRTESH